MSFSNKFGEFIKKILPAPFTIAVILSFLTFILALFTQSTEDSNSFFKVLEFWEKGLWDNQLMVFAMQMMLMLVLGHALALSAPLEKIINKKREKLKFYKKKYPENKILENIKDNFDTVATVENFDRFI